MAKTIISILMFILLVSIAYAEERTIIIDSYNILEENGYETLVIDGGESITELYNGVLPKITYRLVESKPVDKITLIGFEDPVSLNVNYPFLDEDEQGNEIYTDRECTSMSEDASFYVNDPLYEGDDIIYVLDIFPIDILDCEKGDIRLYQTIKYNVDYLESPVLIKEIETYNLERGQTASVFVNFNQIPDGKLIIKDDYGNIVAEKEANEKLVTLKFSVPEDMDVQNFAVEYTEDTKLISKKEFTLASFEWGDFDFEALPPTEGKNDYPINITFNNKLNEEIEVKLTEGFIDIKGEFTTSFSKKIKLKPGSSSIKEILNPTEKEGKHPDIKVIAEYGGLEVVQMHNTMTRKDPNVKTIGDVMKEQGVTIPVIGQEPEKKTNYANIIGIIAALVLILGVALVAYLFLFRKRR
jgi:hypothetical protein